MTEATAPTAAEKPVIDQNLIAPTFDIAVNGEKQTIKMTFNRLNRVCKVVGDLSQVQNLLLDPVVSEAVLVELFSGSKAQIDIDDYDLNPQDTANLLAWAGAHVLDFFIKLGESFNVSVTPLMAKAEEQARKTSPTS